MPAIVMDIIERLRRGVDLVPTATSGGDPADGAGGAVAGTSGTNMATDATDTGKSKLNDVTDALMKQMSKFPREFPNFYLCLHVGAGRTVAHATSLKNCFKMWRFTRICMHKIVSMVA